MTPELRSILSGMRSVIVAFSTTRLLPVRPTVSCNGLSSLSVPLGCFTARLVNRLNGPSACAVPVAPPAPVVTHSIRIERM